MKKIVLLVLLLGVQERVSAAVQPADSVEMRSGVFTAGEITVTGKKNTAGRRSAPQRWTISTEKTIAEAVNLLPGINLGHAGARNEGMIYVRGFDMRQFPLYVDGIPLSVPYDGYIDPNRFTTFDLSEVTVSRGYSSVLFGPNTLGGAMNLVSRKPEENIEGNMKGGLVFDEDRIASSFGTLNLGTNRAAGICNPRFPSSIRISGRFRELSNRHGTRMAEKGTTQHRRISKGRSRSVIHRTARMNIPCRSSASSRIKGFRCVPAAILLLPSGTGSIPTGTNRVCISLPGSHSAGKPV